MQAKIEVLFTEGLSLLEYGASINFPFDSSASRHWRELGRRLLDAAHALSIVTTLDEDVADSVNDELALLG